MSAGRDELVARARAARKHAHCPFSGFAVGCAVRTADGRIFGGANIENASFNLGLCAERVAIFSAIAQGAREIRAVAVVTGADHPVYPCGGCRQILAEFAPRAGVTLVWRDGQSLETTVAALVPHAFVTGDFAASDPADRDGDDGG